MRSLLAATLTGLALLLAAPATADANGKLKAYAKDRARDHLGRFTLANPFSAKGYGNPSSTGQGDVFIEVQPATRTKAGRMTVKMPEWYRGSSYQGGAQARPLYLTDGKQTTAMPATLTVQPGSRYGSFSKATLDVTIPAGTPITKANLKSALRGIHVNPHSLKFAPAPPIKR